jgi:NAD(P)-dependent dehydrogenase (short-subunit alcohol dehydrogenase family)
MERRSTADEQAAAIAFLASSDASYITGQILSVAGGGTASLSDPEMVSFIAEAPIAAT